MSQHLTQSLTLQPLGEALLQNVAEIHYSDQGVQYLSSAYLSVLKPHGIEISIPRRGCPWENGYAERLIRTLKEEEVHLNDYQDVHEARTRIGHFMTQVYNQKRPPNLRDKTWIKFTGLNKRWYFKGDIMPKYKKNDSQEVTKMGTCAQNNAIAVKPANTTLSAGIVE